jgi:hypothetical protein
MLAASPLAAQPQGTAELWRLVALYRSGSAALAVAGLAQLARTAPTTEVRVLAEQHHGFALLRLRSDSAQPVLRRAAAADVDQSLDDRATSDERAAWAAARAELVVPTRVSFAPATAVVGSSDRLGPIIEVLGPVERGSARVRLLLARPDGRDTVLIWSGNDQNVGQWDGTRAGEIVSPGVWTAIVEADDGRGGPAARAFRSLIVDVTPEEIPQPLMTGAVPLATPATRTIAVIDHDARGRRVRHAGRWLLIGSVIATTAMAATSPVVDRTAAGSPPRVALATGYVAGLAVAALGAVRLWSALTRDETVAVTVPDEARLAEARVTRVGATTGAAASRPLRVTVSVPNPGGRP